jgi:hypothetical protein
VFVITVNHKEVTTAGVSDLKNNIIYMNSMMDCEFKVLHCYKHALNVDCIEFDSLVGVPTKDSRHVRLVVLTLPLPAIYQMYWVPISSLVLMAPLLY